MTMRLLTYYYLLICGFGLSNGLLETKTFVSRRIRPTPIARAPAGAESMFRRAKHMRKRQIRRIKGAWNNNRPSWKFRLRRRQRVQIDQIDLWGVEKTRKDLSLPSWVCTDLEEERRLAAMKIILQNELEALDSKTIRRNGRHVKVTSAFPDVYSDFRLLRFLRKDKVQDPVTAAVRYREFLQWRHTNNVDEIRSLVETNPFEPPQELSIVAKYLPCDFQPDRPSDDGVVPILLKVGSWDTATITQLIRNNELSLGVFLQYWAYMFDSVHARLYEESMRQKQMVFIDEVCDLSGMSLKQFSPAFISTVLKPWMDLTQSNYPETAKRIVFLNPPKIMSIVWRMVTPMVSPGTVAKVSMHPSFLGSGQDYISAAYARQEDAHASY